ncbi:MAG: hypothetical protein WA985_11715 [Erythrobacter sp.]|uniref:hypothetical protein n=1 Tax=Erythrobacter sp. TaxID=1042 RepID=UPI003C76A130
MNNRFNTPVRHERTGAARPLERGRERAEDSPRDWRKAMSDHVAYALLVYTALQIFLTVKAMNEGLPSILPYMALVILVAAIIPACRWFEKRWTVLSDAEAHDPALASDFRRDTIALWLMAILLPVAITGLCMVFFALG